MSKVLPAALILLASASVARAADPPAVPQPQLGGPLVKGVCFLSEDQVLQTAKVAVAANQRLQALKTQAQAEINAARAPIDVDYKTLQADAPKGPAADIERRRLAIQARYQTVQDVTDQRNREIEATRVKVIARLSGEMQPVLAQVYKAHGCGLLLNRALVIGGNMGEDLTAEVIKGVDARAAPIAFDREILPPAKP
jgi:Skp family chaperone for outer membrane proteins